MHGLTRVRGFTQDDAHIFCTPEQVKEEFKTVIDLVQMVLGKLGFTEYTAQISLRDPDNKEKYIGSDENWAKAENAIVEAAGEKGLKTVTVLGLSVVLFNGALIFTSSSFWNVNIYAAKRCCLSLSNTAFLSHSTPVLLFP